MLKAKLCFRIDKKCWQWIHKCKRLILIGTLFYLVSCNEKLNSNQVPNRNQGNQQNESSSIKNDKRFISNHKGVKAVVINNQRFVSGRFLWFKCYLKFTIENMGELPITTEDQLNFTIEIRSETGLDKNQSTIIKLKKIMSLKSRINNVKTVEGNLIEPGGIEEFTLPVILSSETEKKLQKTGTLVLRLKILSSKDEGSKVIGSNIVRYNEMIDYGRYYQHGYFPGLLWALLILWLFVLVL